MQPGDRSLYHGVRLIACAGLLSLTTAAAYAGTAGSTFPVNITLNNPLAGIPTAPAIVSNYGFCINQSLSRATNAVVTVTCSNNQFVSIQPMPNAPLLGSHGGAHRLMLHSFTNSRFEDITWSEGSGTITTMQISHKKRQQWEIMEVQVSY